MFDTLFHRHLRVPYVLHVHIDRAVKKPRATVLFLHGIGSSGAEWEGVIRRLPEDISLFSIDLLGFGKSPRPDWAVYSASTQARSIIATLVRLRLRQRFVIVGHSLGALVAVEVAKRYPWLVRSLVLCSPPFYKPDMSDKKLSSDEILRRIYRQFEQRPEGLVKLSQFAMRYKLVNQAFDLTLDNVGSYLATLKASIINQTSLEDAKQLSQPMTIIYGALDPFVIDRNIKELAETRPGVKLARIIVGHEIVGKYVRAVAQEITDHIDTA